jgi:hypothetical protein
MKSPRHFLAIALMAIGLHANADDAAKATHVSAEVAGIKTLDVLRVSPCKTNGDGTYVEMITTMASVLPPAEADALLARYCEECFRRKFSLSQSR